MNTPTSAERLGGGYIATPNVLQSIPSEYLSLLRPIVTPPGANNYDFGISTPSGTPKKRRGRPIGSVKRKLDYNPNNDVSSSQLDLEVFSAEVLESMLTYENTEPFMNTTTPNTPVVLPRKDEVPLVDPNAPTPVPKRIRMQLSPIHELVNLFGNKSPAYAVAILDKTKREKEKEVGQSNLYHYFLHPVENTSKSFLPVPTMQVSLIHQDQITKISNEIDFDIPKRFKRKALDAKSILHVTQAYKQINMVGIFITTTPFEIPILASMDTTKDSLFDLPFSHTSPYHIKLKENRSKLDRSNEHYRAICHAINLAIPCRCVELLRYMYNQPNASEDILTVLRIYASMRHYDMIIKGTSEKETIETQTTKSIQFIRNTETIQERFPFSIFGELTNDIVAQKIIKNDKILEQLSSERNTSSGHILERTLMQLEQYDLSTERIITHIRSTIDVIFNDDTIPEEVIKSETVRIYLEIVRGRVSDKLGMLKTRSHDELTSGMELFMTQLYTEIAEIQIFNLIPQINNEQRFKSTPRYQTLLQKVIKTYEEERKASETLAQTMDNHKIEEIMQSLIDEDVIANDGDVEPSEDNEPSIAKESEVMLQELTLSEKTFESIEKEVEVQTHQQSQSTFSGYTLDDITAFLLEDLHNPTPDEISLENVASPNKVDDFYAGTEISPNLFNPDVLQPEEILEPVEVSNVNDTSDVYDPPEVEIPTSTPYEITGTSNYLGDISSSPLYQIQTFPTFVKGAVFWYSEAKTLTRSKNRETYDRKKTCVYDIYISYLNQKRQEEIRKENVENKIPSKDLKYTCAGDVLDYIIFHTSVSSEVQSFMSYREQDLTIFENKTAEFIRYYFYRYLKYPVERIIDSNFDHRDLLYIAHEFVAYAETYRNFLLSMLNFETHVYPKLIPVDSIVHRILCAQYNLAENLSGCPWLRSERIATSERHTSSDVLRKKKAALERHNYEETQNALFENIVNCANDAERIYVSPSDLTDDSDDHYIPKSNPTVRSSITGNEYLVSPEILHKLSYVTALEPSMNYKFHPSFDINNEDLQTLWKSVLAAFFRIKKNSWCLGSENGNGNFEDEIDTTILIEKLLDFSDARRYFGHEIPNRPFYCQKDQMWDYRMLECLTLQIRVIQLSQIAVVTDNILSSLEINPYKTSSYVPRVFVPSTASTLPGIIKSADYLNMKRIIEQPKIKIISSVSSPLSTQLRDGFFYAWNHAFDKNAIYIGDLKYVERDVSYYINFEKRDERSKRIEMNHLSKIPEDFQQVYENTVIARSILPKPHNYNAHGLIIFNFINYSDEIKINIMRAESQIRTKYQKISAESVMQQNRSVLDEPLPSMIIETLQKYRNESIFISICQKLRKKFNLDVILPEEQMGTIGQRSTENIRFILPLQSQSKSSKTENDRIVTANVKSLFSWADIANQISKYSLSFSALSPDVKNDDLISDSSISLVESQNPFYIAIALLKCIIKEFLPIMMLSYTSELMDYVQRQSKNPNVSTSKTTIAYRREMMDVLKNNVIPSLSNNNEIRRIISEGIRYSKLHDENSHTATMEEMIQLLTQQNSPTFQGYVRRVVNMIPPFEENPTTRDTLHAGLWVGRKEMATIDKMIQGSIGKNKAHSLDSVMIRMKKIKMLYFLADQIRFDLCVVMNSANYDVYKMIETEKNHFSGMLYYIDEEVDPTTRDLKYTDVGEIRQTRILHGKEVMRPFVTENITNLIKTISENTHLKSELKRLVRRNERITQLLYFMFSLCTTTRIFMFDAESHDDLIAEREKVRISLLHHQNIGLVHPSEEDKINSSTKEEVVIETSVPTTEKDIFEPISFSKTIQSDGIINEDPKKKKKTKKSKSSRGAEEGPLIYSIEDRFLIARKAVFDRISANRNIFLLRVKSPTQPSINPYASNDNVISSDYIYYSLTGICLDNAYFARPMEPIHKSGFSEKFSFQTHPSFIEYIRFIAHETYTNPNSNSTNVIREKNVVTNTILPLIHVTVRDPLIMEEQSLNSITHARPLDDVFDTIWKETILESKSIESKISEVRGEPVKKPSGDKQINPFRGVIDFMKRSFEYTQALKTQSLQRPEQIVLDLPQSLDIMGLLIPETHIEIIKNLMKQATAKTHILVKEEERSPQKHRQMLKLISSSYHALINVRSKESVVSNYRMTQMPTLQSIEHIDFMKNSMQRIMAKLQTNAILGTFRSDLAFIDKLPSPIWLIATLVNAKKNYPTTFKGVMHGELSEFYQYSIHTYHISKDYAREKLESLLFIKSDESTVERSNKSVPPNHICRYFKEPFYTDIMERKDLVKLFETCIHVDIYQEETTIGLYPKFHQDLLVLPFLPKNEVGSTRNQPKDLTSLAPEEVLKYFAVHQKEDDEYIDLLDFETKRRSLGVCGKTKIQGKKHNILFAVGNVAYLANIIQELTENKQNYSKLELVCAWGFVPAYVFYGIDESNKAWIEAISDKQKKDLLYSLWVYAPNTTIRSQNLAISTFKEPLTLVEKVSNRIMVEGQAIPIITLTEFTSNPERDKIKFNRKISSSIMRTHNIRISKKDRLTSNNNNNAAVTPPKAPKKSAPKPLSTSPVTSSSSGTTTTTTTTTTSVSVARNVFSDTDSTETIKYARKYLEENILSGKGVNPKDVAKTIIIKSGLNGNYTIPHFPQNPEPQSIDVDDESSMTHTYTNDTFNKFVLKCVENHTKSDDTAIESLLALVIPEFFSNENIKVNMEPPVNQNSDRILRKILLLTFVHIRNRSNIISNNMTQSLDYVKTCVTKDLKKDDELIEKYKVRILKKINTTMNALRGKFALHQLMLRDPNQAKKVIQQQLGTCFTFVEGIALTISAVIYNKYRLRRMFEELERKVRFQNASAML